MVQAICIDKLRDRYKNIYGYKLQDYNSNIIDVTPEDLKKAIKSKKITVANLTLTSDNRLIDKKMEDIRFLKRDIFKNKPEKPSNCQLKSKEQIINMHTFETKLNDIWLDLNRCISPFSKLFDNEYGSKQHKDYSRHSCYIYYRYGWEKFALHTILNEKSKSFECLLIKKSGRYKDEDYAEYKIELLNEEFVSWSTLKDLEKAVRYFKLYVIELKHIIDIEENIEKLEKEISKSSDERLNAYNKRKIENLKDSIARRKEECEVQRQDILNNKGLIFKSDINI